MDSGNNIDLSETARGDMDSENHSVVIRSIGSHSVKSTASRLIILLAYTTGYDQSEQYFGATEPTGQYIAVQEQTPHFQDQETGYYGYPMNNAVIVPNTLQVQIEDGVQRGLRWLIFAILCTLCCCFPIGICAIVMVTQAIKKYALRDISGGHQSLSHAKKLVIISVVFGILIYILISRIVLVNNY